MKCALSSRTLLLPWTKNNHSFPSFCLHRLTPKNHYRHRAPALTYRCDIAAEPLHHYRPGGYHPLALGDHLQDRRYEILHKLGWGSYSTTWAAKDRKDDRYVAVKIKTSASKQGNEARILQALSSVPVAGHPGSAHVNRLLDHFTVDGPNGCHECLVLELAGPSVADVVDLYCRDDRLPPRLARVVATQPLLGTDFLAANAIGHGDLHTRNLAFRIPDLDLLREDDFMAKLGQPEMGPVMRTDGEPLGPEVPAQIVRPAAFRRREILQVSSPSIQIIDFGEAFFDDDPPCTLHTPLPVRAPEVVFGDRLDHRVDLWSAGCLIFELIAGHPPFDSIAVTPPVLVEQMIALALDELPSRWQAQWDAMRRDLPLPRDCDKWTMQESLEDAYFFDADKKADFPREELMRVAAVIEPLLRFEQSSRAASREVLVSEWFRG